MINGSISFRIGHFVETFFSLTVCTLRFNYTVGHKNVPL